MNPLKYIRVFSNEPCPCGSNLKYKECCKNKKIIIAQASKKPPEIQAMEIMKKSILKYCLHPEQSHCKGKIKKAHALQNNKIINILAGEERHVYVFDVKKKPLIIPMRKGSPATFVPITKISANKATTETCFCDLHDNTVFAAIEKGAPDFDDSSDEMKFIYAYKAFIFEYYKQIMAYSIYENLFKKNPRAFKSPVMIGIYRMISLKMDEFEPTKAHFDKEIISGDFNGIATCVVRIPGQIKFATYAYIAPDFDLDGRKIKHTIKGVMHRLSVTVFPESTHSYILLSCLEIEKNVYEEFFAQLETASIDKIKFYMSLILPLYSENIVLSPMLWDSWDQEIQAAYTYYVNLHDQEAAVYGRAMKMVLRNASRCKSEFDYSKSCKIDLFN